MNYVKVFEDKSIVVVAVDKWIFEQDVNRGFLGEALAGKLIFPYVALTDNHYLHAQEVKLKKRLIIELLENLVLDYPELSYEFCIKPEYFMYETMSSRARLFPPTAYMLQRLIEEKGKKENLANIFRGYLEASKELEKSNVIKFSHGYIRITERFVDKVRKQNLRFTNLLKTAQKAQRTLFTSLLSFLPQTLSIFSQNEEMLLRLQKAARLDSKYVERFEDPQNYLYVPTESGLVPLANRIGIEGFAKKILKADGKAKIKIEKLGGVLNDVYVFKTSSRGKEKKVIVKRFKDWSSFKWFPLTLWSVGTRTFAVLGRSRLEKECAINQFLGSKGFVVPKILYVSPAERLIFMECVEGESLTRIIKKIASSKSGNALKKELSTVRTVGKLLAKVHSLNVSLGDTKPENFMIQKDDNICMLDFEQASRNGDKVWDIAEFLYYAGHDLPPSIEPHAAELIAKTFIEGYLQAGGDLEIVRKAGTPKYTKVFSVFTLPHIMFAISTICRKVTKLEAKL
jgi:tRNA A-37 threonylcarbamoyl transferase component Bud32